MRDRPPIDHVAVGMLGILTICAYGTWYYSFGVLLDPILLDTGWRESTLAAGFSAGAIGTGVGAIFAGRLLDRLGTVPLFLTAGIVGGASIVGASFATNVGTFVVLSTIGMALFGAIGFYHVTMTAAVRSNPGASARAIAVLTIWGALASAIYLPGTAWLLRSFDWRSTVRILAASGILAFLLAAVVVRVRPHPSEGGRLPLRRTAVEIVAEPGPRLFAGAIAMGGIAMSTMLVYQVPVMTAAGLPVTTAATMAGVRGFAQLGGRLPLTPLVERLGSNGALMAAFGAITLGGALLVVAGNVVVAAVFALVAGFGIGAFSPLQGIKASELFDPARMGATMGLLAAVQTLAGATGPAAAGLVAELSGDRRWAGAITVVAGATALGLVIRLGSLTRSESASAPID